ncbi:hypothetical protein NBRC10513v2_004183 [Rhodotorula toruloides]
MASNDGDHEQQKVVGGEAGTGTGATPWIGGSKVSHRSELRKARAEAGLLEEFEAKMNALMAAFASRKEQLADELEVEDAMSAAGQEQTRAPRGTADEVAAEALDRKIKPAEDDLDWLRALKASTSPSPLLRNALLSSSLSPSPTRAPQGTVDEMAAEVLDRKIKSAEDDLDRLRALKASTSPSPLLRNALLSSSLSPSPSPRLNRVKIKVDKPKPCSGKYEWQERENWLRSAMLYMGSLGVGLDETIGEELIPDVFYVRWFDLTHARFPSHSLRAVFDAVKAHWTDDSAAEKAVEAFRSARQGTATARAFGSTVDALANACFDRIDFLKVQLAARKAQGSYEGTFSEAVCIAPLTDSLKDFKPANSAKSPSSSSASSKRNGGSADVLTSRQPSSLSSSSSGKTLNWIAAAREWQKANPMDKKAQWHDAKGAEVPRKLWCYNCGELGSHFSRSCTKARKDPDVVVIAALHRSGSFSPFSSSPSVTSGEPAVTEAPFSMHEGKEEGAQQSAHTALPNLGLSLSTLLPMMQSSPPSLRLPADDEKE